MDSVLRFTAHKLAGAMILFGAVHLAVDPAQAQVVRPVTDVKTAGAASGAIDDSGTVVVALSKDNP